MDCIKKLLKQMEDNHITKNYITFSTVMQLHVNNLDIQGARNLIIEMEKAKCIPDVRIYLALLKIYLHLKQFSEVERLLNEMQQKNCPPSEMFLNMIITAYAEHGNIEKSEEMTQRAINLKIASIETFNSLMKVYTQKGLLVECKKVLSRAIKIGFTPNNYTYNLLLIIYVKSGDVVGAESLFSEMKKNGVKPNLLNFNTILNIYVKIGLLDKAQTILYEIKAAGFEPDNYTFNGLLELAGCVEKIKNQKQYY